MPASQAGRHGFDPRRPLQIFLALFRLTFMAFRITEKKILTGGAPVRKLSITLFAALLLVSVLGTARGAERQVLIQTELVSVSRPPLEQFWKIGVYGGVEKEGGSSSGGRGTIQASGVLPIAGSFGLQGGVESGWGAGWRFGLNAGPVLDFGAGKVGAFVNYQYRGLRDNSFVHFRPALALYFNQTNLDFWYSHPISGRQTGGGRAESGSNRLQWTMSYFNSSDWASFLRRDNVELTVGLQVNNFAGGGSGGTGVGPVLGLKFMPVPSLGVNLVRSTFDFNDSRYRVDSGLEYYFSRGSPTLKETSRKSLEDEPGESFHVSVRPRFTF